MAKRIGVVVVCLLVGLSLLMVGGNPVEAKAVTLRAIGFESCIVDGLKKQAEAYMKANPDVKVEIEATAYTNLHEKELVELTGATGRYDVLSIVTEWMPGYIASGFLEPLDEYIKKSPPEGGLDSWVPGLLNFQKDAVGKLYGLPHHDGPQFLYYRKDLFEDPANQKAFKEKYGYDLKAPETWKQFLDIATFFTDPAKDFWGTVLTAKYGEQQLAHDFWLLLPLFGGSTGVDEKLNPTFNGPAGVECAQFYADLINKYKVAPPSSTTFGIPEAGSFYLSGKAAMHWNWAHIGAYAEMPKESKIVGKNGFVVFPIKEGVGKHSVYGSYWVLSIAKDSKNKDAAWDFIKFVTDPQHDKILADVGCIPCRKSSWQDPALIKQNGLYTLFEPAYSGMVTSTPRVPEYEQVNDIMQRYLSKIIAKDLDAKAALDAAAKEYTDLMKKIGRIK